MTDKLFRCDKCGLPFARLKKSSIIVESQHHGEKHTNSMSVWDLVLLVINPVPLEDISPITEVER